MEQKFKLGDKVKVKNWKYGDGVVCGVCVGKEGTHYHLDFEKEIPFHIKYLGTHLGHFWEDQLEKI